MGKIFKFNGEDFEVSEPKNCQIEVVGKGLTGDIKIHEATGTYRVGVREGREFCTARGFLDSGLTVFASTPPRPARGGRVARPGDHASPARNRVTNHRRDGHARRVRFRFECRSRRRLHRDAQLCRIPSLTPPPSLYRCRHV